MKKPNILSVRTVLALGAMLLALPLTSAFDSAQAAPPPPGLRRGGPRPPAPPRWAPAKGLRRKNDYSWRNRNRYDQTRYNRNRWDRNDRNRWDRDRNDRNRWDRDRNRDRKDWNRRR